MKKVLMFTLLLGVMAFSYAGNKIATDYFNAGDYTTAKSYFLSGSIDAMDSYYLGQIYLKANKKDSAQYYFNKGLQIDPANAYNKVGIATINNDAKGLDAVAKDKLYKKDVKMMIAIADAYQTNNNKIQAAAYVEKAKKADKKNPLSYIFEGDQLMTLKQTNEAASKYENAVYFDPNSKEALLKLSQIYENVRTSVAVEYLNKTISIDPQFVPGLSSLADLSYHKGFYPQALDAFDKYLKLVKPSSADNERYAAILYFNKKYDESLDAISKAPSTFIMNRLKMYSQNELKKYPEALLTGANLFKIAKPTDVFIPQDYNTYADLLVKNSQFAEAATNYEKAFSLDTTKTDILKDIAKAYGSAKDYDNSAKYYSIITAKPNCALSDVFMLGRTYYIAGTNETLTDTVKKADYLKKADITFSKMIERLPDNYMGYFWRARTSAALDPETTQGLAKPYYEKAVELMLPQKDQYKNEIMEGYRYLGYYSYLKNDVVNAKLYFNKVLEINPTDTVSLQAIKGMEAPKKSTATTTKKPK